MGAYEETLEDIQKTYGMVPGFMMVFARNELVLEWPSWKKDDLDEIYLERARYLLSIDRFLEEKLSTEMMSGIRKVEFSSTVTPEASEEVSN